MIRCEECGNTVHDDGDGKSRPFPNWVKEAARGPRLKLRTFDTIPARFIDSEISRGAVRVLRITRTKTWPSIEGYTRVNVCKNTRYGNDLSPMVLGPVDLAGLGGYASNIEDGWQCSKVWPFHLRGHTAECSRWIQNWSEYSENGRYSGQARRHRDPQRVTTKRKLDAIGANPNAPLFIICPYTKERLSYAYARKRMYMPWYARLARSTNAYGDLECRHLHGENLILLDFDGPEQGGKYDRDLDEATLREMLADDTRPFGHALVLACMLMGLHIWEN